MPLVYDIGLHNGADTRQYLKEGCRVVAIDANPAMCAAAETEFRREIDNGILRVLNCGISQKAEKLPFWICDDVTEWSSFNLEIASTNGAAHHSITVDCLPLQDITSRFGSPDYMKIDIEGNDRFCLEGMNRENAPSYISLEVYDANAGTDIDRLFDIGFRDFKIICQNNAWNDVAEGALWFYRLRSRKLIGLLQKANAVVRWVNGRRSILVGRHAGGSGPWGERSAGRWRSQEEVKRVLAALGDIEPNTGFNGLDWWFDIHAKLT